MKIQYYTASSLDGFLATEDDDVSWLFPLGSLSESSYDDFIAQVGAIVMGSATYEWMLRNAETLQAETGSAWPYAQPTWVLSSRLLPQIAGADIRFARGDVRSIHHDLCAAASGGNVWIVGGGDLAGQFYDAGLLDELIIQVGSVTLGRGKPLLPRRILHPNLTLTSVTRSGRGMVELRYNVSTHGE